MKDGMKFIFLIIFLILITSCSQTKQNAKKCFVIDKLDGSKYIFFIDDSVKICLPDLNFLNRLPVGIDVPKEDISFINEDLIIYLMVPNTKRDTLIYGKMATSIF